MQSERAAGGGVQGAGEAVRLVQVGQDSRRLDGAAEAKLIALACSEPPKGRSRWTLQLLEQAVVE